MASSEEFEVVFRELLPRAYRVAFRVLGTRAEAEEAAAEALARASMPDRSGSTCSPV